jgi:cell division protein FtsB
MKSKIIQWIKVKRLEICCIFLLLVVLGGSWVGNTAKINNLLTTVSKQKQELVDLKANIQLLESRVVELKSADRIITIAENKLYLEKPKTLPIVILDSISQN